MDFGSIKEKTTIRKWLNDFCKGKPLEKCYIEGVKVYTTKNSMKDDWKQCLDTLHLVGQEVFTLTNKTFITDSELLKYVDKPLTYIARMGVGGVGLDGEGNMRKWVGLAFYVLDGAK